MDNHGLITGETLVNDFSSLQNQIKDKKKEAAAILFDVNKTLTYELICTKNWITKESRRKRN